MPKPVNSKCTTCHRHRYHPRHWSCLSLLWYRRRTPHHDQRHRRRLQIPRTGDRARLRGSTLARNLVIGAARKIGLPLGTSIDRQRLLDVVLVVTFHRSIAPLQSPSDVLHDPEVLISSVLLVSSLFLLLSFVFQVPLQFACYYATSYQPSQPSAPTQSQAGP